MKDMTHTQPNFLKGIDEHTSMHECRTTKDFSTSPATSLWPIDQSRKERRHWMLLRVDDRGTMKVTLTCPRPGMAKGA